MDPASLPLLLLQGPEGLLIEKDDPAILRSSWLSGPADTTPSAAGKAAPQKATHESEDLVELEGPVKQHRQDKQAGPDLRTASGLHPQLSRGKREREVELRRVDQLHLRFALVMKGEWK